MIEVITITDYDGYFESIVKSKLEVVMNPNIKKIYITAGPYRPYGSAYEWISETEVHLDFYSATRVGFGSIDLDSLLLSLNVSQYDNTEGNLLGHTAVTNYIKKS